MEKFIIIKKIAEEKFIMIDGEKSIDINYEIHEEKVSLKSGEKINHWILIPENSIERKGFRLEDFDGDVSEKKYFERKKSERKKSEKSEESEIFDFEKYLNDDEKKILEDLKEKALKRFEKIQEMKKDEKYLELMKIKKNLDELVSINFIDENNETYQKNLKEIEKFENDFQKEINE